MKIIFILITSIVLAGCATGNGFNAIDVVTARSYVVRTAPDQLKTLPPLPPKIANPDTATNTQIATFINNTEQYVTDLESMVQTLVNFYEKPVNATEAGTLQPVTPRDAATPNGARVIQPQTTTANGNAAPAQQSRFSAALARVRATLTN